MLLRVVLGEVDPEIADWWTRVQTLSQAEQRREFGVRRRRRTDGKSHRRASPLPSG
jgi:hypothetical protein